MIDATATTLYPGGIRNDGFAVAWAEERQQNAEPASPGHGQAWAYTRIEEGDQTCAANQALHGEAANLMAEDRSKLDVQPGGRRRARPGHVRAQDRRADVHGLPVGGRADRRALRRSRAALHRHGAASGSRSPTARTSTRSIRIRITGCTTSWSCTSRTKRRSSTQAVVHAAAPVIYQEAMGLAENRRRDASVRPDPDAADLRIGAGGLRSAAVDPGAVRQRRRDLAARARRRPVTRTRASNSRSPNSRSPARRRASWYFGPGGTLNEKQPSAEGVDSYTSDANAVPLTDYGANTGGGGLWGNASQWEWNWAQPPAGSAVSYVSAPLDERHDRRRRRRRASLGQVLDADVDLQATVSEVRPTATRRSSRTAGCGRASASSPRLGEHAQAEADGAAADPDDARLRRGTDARGPVRPGRRSRCTSRATRTARARASGSRSPRRTGRSRSGRSATPQPEGGDCERVDRLLAEHALEPDPADRARCRACRRRCPRARACATSPAAPTRRT